MPDPTSAVDALRADAVRRGDLVAIALSDAGIALSWSTGSWKQPGPYGAVVVSAVEAALRPRWVWWSNGTPSALTAAGVRVATCWDVAAVHRLLFGGWHAQPARVWAQLHDLSIETIPAMGQLGLLDLSAEEGADPEDAVRPDGHLRPEWTSGGWGSTVQRLTMWAATAMQACRMQQARIDALPGTNGADATARSESAAELLCTELALDGLPFDVATAEALLAATIGGRPRNECDADESRRRRDELVTNNPAAGPNVDLRNPAHVRQMLSGAGIDVTDTRAWRLEPFREAHPLVDALLTWRKAERMATTYGYAWLDANVGPDGRLRGAWTGSDGAAGRMTAQAGLHNMPADMREAVMAEPGHVFVHADLGQIEPRVLAAVSGDVQLAAATASHDLYAPIAERLGVARPVAKVAVLAAMYGQTSGTAGEALRGLENAYPVAMQFLRNADRSGQAGRDVRTYGGRMVRMWVAPDGRENRSATAARGRYARNAVIQGAAAELFKAWAVTVRGRAVPIGGRIVLCLHDELLIQVPEEHGAAMVRVLEEALPDAAQRWMPGSPVRYVAKASVIRRWSEAKG